MVGIYEPPDNTSQLWTNWRTGVDNAIVAGARISVAFLPQPQSTPNMTVRVLAGALRISDVLTEIAAQNTGTITAPVGNPRIDRVVLNSATGAVEVLTGTPGASPVAPAIPADRLPICRFQLSPSTTAISAGMIIDERLPTGGTSEDPTIATIVAGEALSDRDLIYQDVFNQRGGGADRWYKVDTDATSPVRIGPDLAIALAAISSGASGRAKVQPGRVAGFSGLTVGALVFASATAGGITQTVPAIPSSGAQNASRRIGKALSATEIEFKPEDDTVFTARNSAVAVDGTITVQHWSDAGARDREQSAYLVQASSTAVVPGGTGTNIGDMTGGGGLAAAFDGTVSKAAVACALRSTVTNAFIGKTFSPAKTFQSVAVYGSNNLGYFGAGGAQTIDFVLRGKTGSAPSSRTDGTSLGTLSFVEVSNESVTPRTITFSDQTTAFDHVWIDASTSGGTDNFYVGQLQFTEISGAARDEPLSIGGSLTNATATDRVNVRYDDGSGANADTRTTFINRTNATRDLAVEVVL
jgi:hypothetical protein